MTHLPPQECGLKESLFGEQYGGNAIGEEVVLNKQASVGDDTGWKSSMDKFVGVMTRVTSLTGIDLRVV